MDAQSVRGDGIVPPPSTLKIQKPDSSAANRTTQMLETFKNSSFSLQQKPMNLDLTPNSFVILENFKEMSWQEQKPLRRSVPREKSFKGLIALETRSSLRDAIDRVEQEIIQTDSATCASLLRACGNLRALSEGKRVHGIISDRGLGQDIFLRNHLIEMYSKCGAIRIASSMFEEMHLRNVFSWTIMIAAWVQHGDGAKAMLLYEQMQVEGVPPNNITFISILGSCCSVTVLPQGRLLHAGVIDAGYDSDVLVGTSLVNMYGKCGSVEDAQRVFEALHKRNLVSWNSMIEAYAQHGRYAEAFQLFHDMHQEGLEPDKITFISTLGAFSCLATLDKGKAIHACIIERGYESDAVMGTGLINMYSKSDSLEDASRVFGKLHQVLSVVSWNAMIAAYTQHGQVGHAIRLFLNLQSEGVKPDKVTFISILGACSSLAALAQGKLIHAHILDCGFISDVVVGTALITMYGKCGSVIKAQIVFDEMLGQDLVSWNAIIAAYAQHGHDKEAFQLLSEMQQAGIKPDEVTFVSILSVCSRAGLVDEGLQFFTSMSKDYGIAPLVEHYGCVIDLFCRAGLLDEAEEFVKTIPFQESVVVWETLLAACQMHGDVSRGKRVAECVLKLNSQNPAPYVLLSNIYAAEGNWDEVAKVRRGMLNKGVKKQPERSLIVVNDFVHEFVVRDKSHPQADQIYAELEKLHRLMPEAEYVPNTKLVLHDVEEELNEGLFCYHSEKLALAFGLISTPSGTPVCVVKNLRACPNCHSAIKVFSKIVEREIIVKDATHLHNFHDGICSCGDYW